MATKIKAYVNHLGPVIELPTIAAMRTSQPSGQRIRSFRRTKAMDFVLILGIAQRGHSETLGQPGSHDARPVLT